MLQHPAMAVATTRTGEASNDEAEHEERGEGAFHPGAGAAFASVRFQGASSGGGRRR